MLRNWAPLMVCRISGSGADDSAGCFMKGIRNVPMQHEHQQTEHEHHEHEHGDNHDHENEYPHGHSHAVSGGKRGLLIALGITLLMMVAEIIGASCQTALRF